MWVEEMEVSPSSLYFDSLSVSELCLLSSSVSVEIFSLSSLICIFKIRLGLLNSTAMETTRSGRNYAELENESNWR